MDKYSGLSDFLKEFYIPTYVLSPESEALAMPIDPPESPVLVFINSKSGGQLGGELLLSYRSLLNDKQVGVVIVIEIDDLPSCLALNPLSARSGL